MEQLKTAVAESRSVRQVLGRLGLKQAGGNYAQIKKYLEELHIERKHFTGPGWSKNSKDGRLPLELDHINGNPKDNRLINLRVLCPNCHSLKQTHRGKNIKK